jgi:hypothetical protein
MSVIEMPVDTIGMVVIGVIRSGGHKIGFIIIVNPEDGISVTGAEIIGVSTAIEMLGVMSIDGGSMRAIGDMAGLGVGRDLKDV